MTNDQKLDALELWATLAAEELQDFIDDAQQAAGNPLGTDQLPGTRALLIDLDKILLPELMAVNQSGDAEQQIDLLDRVINA